tara:strand:+ start:12230 stop:12475 length:246 start_codon:yes stop_codon:yes gene_type:complete
MNNPSIKTNGSEQPEFITLRNTKGFLLWQRKLTAELKMSYSSTLTFVQDSFKPLIAKKLIGIPLFSSVDFPCADLCALLLI